MTASTPRPDVVAFVAAVRAHLDDLDAAEVEELTGGLAADLTDAARDHVGPLEPRFGPPQAYADELRSAAGLAPRGRRRGWSLLPELHDDLAAMKAHLRAHPRRPAIEGFLVTLRPTWWVMRAVVAVWLLNGILHGRMGLGSLVLLVAFVVISVELGRGRWTGRRGLSPLVLAGNVLAAVATPILVGQLIMSTDSYGGYSVYEGVGTVPGLVRAGEPVSNVFAFDAQGRPLTDVQLFDQEGRPLAVDPLTAGQVPDGEIHIGTGSQPVAAVDAYGRQLWNVFPLRSSNVDFGRGEDGRPFITSAPLPVAPPLVSVPPLAELRIQAPDPTPTDAPAVTPTEPTDGPTTEPTTEPQPTDTPTTAPTTARPTSGATTTAPRPSATR